MNEAEVSTQADAATEDKNEKSQEVMNKAEVSTQAAGVEDKDEKSQEVMSKASWVVRMDYSMYVDDNTKDSFDAAMNSWEETDAWAALPAIPGAFRENQNLNQLFQDVALPTVPGALGRDDRNQNLMKVDIEPHHSWHLRG